MQSFASFGARALVAAVAIAAFSLVGCTFDPEWIDLQPCGNTEDCPEGFICASGACVAEDVLFTLDTAVGTDSVVPDVSTDVGELVDETCGGAVCDVDETCCGERCVDTQSDDAHCGACGTLCEPWMTCDAGACVIACPGGQDLCDSTCHDLLTDDAHCGACDSPCGSGEDCIDGGCVVECPLGQIACGVTCYDLLHDPNHCGECAVACDPGQWCEAGVCVLNCSPGFVECSGGCRDTDRDPLHCGACDAVCDATNGVGACEGGLCSIASCDADFGDCDHDPSNGCELGLDDDPDNCGACGVECLFGCAAGECYQEAFSIGDLTVLNCQNVIHGTVTGDDRGGVAVTTDRVFVTGDDSTASFANGDLSDEVDLGARMDGLISDLSTGRLYSLGVGSALLDFGATPLPLAIDTLHELDPTTGTVIGSVALSTPLPLYTGARRGLFAGYGAMIYLDLRTRETYLIAFASGRMELLSGAPNLQPRPCQESTFWGVAEYWLGEHYLVYRANGTDDIVRTRVSDGETSVVASFTNLGDICSFTVSPTEYAWYFHSETYTEFGSANERLHFCDATWSTSICGASGLAECSLECVDLDTDAAHCGSCGATCAADEACDEGACVPCADVGLTKCGGSGGSCVDIEFDSLHCGGCDRACLVHEPYCVEGACEHLYLSCADILAADASATSDVYDIVPNGVPMSVYCEMDDMDGHGGGWTLLAVITNSGGELNWQPNSPAWVVPGPFGAWSDPTVNADAKSPAFDSMPVDELMIVDAPSAVDLITAPGCGEGQPLLSLFQRDSESDPDCAYQCATSVVDYPWSGQSYQDPRALRFRCMDQDGTRLAYGYRISVDDNSFLTTLDNANNWGYNFGFGAGEAEPWADWDATTQDGENASDQGQSLLYGR